MSLTIIIKKKTRKKKNVVRPGNYLGSILKNRFFFFVSHKKPGHLSFCRSCQTRTLSSTAITGRRLSTSTNRRKTCDFGSD